MGCAETALEGRCGPCQESRRQVGCGQTRCQGGAPGAWSTAPLSSHCVMSGSVFLGYNFCSCRTRRKKEIVSKKPHCLYYKKSNFWLLYMLSDDRPDGFWPWKTHLTLGLHPQLCSSSSHVPWAAPTGFRELSWLQNQQKTWTLLLWVGEGHG